MTDTGSVEPLLITREEVWDNKTICTPRDFSIEAAVPSQECERSCICVLGVSILLLSRLFNWILNGIVVFPVFRLLTDFVSLLTYELCLSLWKIARCSVILLLPLFVLIMWYFFVFHFLSKKNGFSFWQYINELLFYVKINERHFPYYYRVPQGCPYYF